MVPFTSKSQSPSRLVTEFVQLLQRHFWSCHRFHSTAVWSNLTKPQTLTATMNVLEGPSMLSMSANLLGLTGTCLFHGSGKSSAPPSSAPQKPYAFSNSTPTLISYFLLGMCIFSVYEWAVHFFLFHSWNLRFAGCHIHMYHHRFPGTTVGLITFVYLFYLITFQSTICFRKTSPRAPQPTPAVSLGSFPVCGQPGVVLLGVKGTSVSFGSRKHPHSLSARGSPLTRSRSSISGR